MSKWLAQLKFDPTSTLASSGNEAIVYFTKRDLLEQEGNTGKSHMEVARGSKDSSKSAVRWFMEIFGEKGSELSGVSLSAISDVEELQSAS